MLARKFAELFFCARATKNCGCCGSDEKMLEKYFIIEKEMYKKALINHKFEQPYVHTLDLWRNDMIAISYPINEKEQSESGFWFIDLVKE